MRIDFKRMVVNAIARRIAYVLVALLLAVLGLGNARAATASDAYAAALQAAQEFNNTPRNCGGVNCDGARAVKQGTTYVGEVKMPNGGEWFAVAAYGWNQPCPGGGEPGPTGCAKDCTTQPPMSFTTTLKVKHATHCFDGCEYLATNDPAAPGYTLSTVVPTSNACEKPEYECLAGYVKTVINPFGEACVPETCPAGQAKNAQGQCEKKKPDECPEGMVLGQDGTCQKEAPQCPAGKVAGPDGSCVDDDDNVCPDGQVKGPDGSCKKDEDDDGEADEDDGTFSGGDNCDQPPQCSGDQIMCGQARIQWRIDCNTRKNRNISGGACGAQPICTGEKCDALEYSGLLMQWRSACALEKLASKTGDSTDTGQPNWTKVDGMNKDGGQGATPGDLDVMEDREFNASSLDTSGFGGSAGSCPGFVASGGGSGMAAGFLATLASPPPFWCSLIGYLRPIVILLAVLAGLYINLRR